MKQKIFRSHFRYTCRHVVLSFCELRSGVLIRTDRIFGHVHNYINYKPLRGYSHLVQDEDLATGQKWKKKFKYHMGNMPQDKTQKLSFHDQFISNKHLLLLASC